MVSFALVAEGLTDLITLETVLYEYYDADLDVHPLQPARDATDEGRQANFGGWEKVFEYCSLVGFEEILRFNDYVVVHIDTDSGEHVNYGVPLTTNGQDRDVAEIIRDARDVLISKIGSPAYDEYKDKIIFAIAVHSTECWLLPLYVSTSSAASRTKNCAGHLSRAAAKKNLTFKKDYESFRLLLGALHGQRAIKRCRDLNPSFDFFIHQLPVLAD